MKHITTSIITFCSLAALLLPGCKKECTSGKEFVVQAPMRVEPQATEIRLGDTITVTIEVPYNNTDLQKNVPVNTAGLKVSEFGLEVAVLNKEGDKIVGEGLDQFTILFLKGVGRRLNGARLQNTFVAEAGKYIYQVKIIPLRKGIVNIINRRAEARDGCTLVDFSPICINNPDNHDLYYDFSSFLGPSDYVIPDNHYYVWVR
jgi:hypothetical protein